MSEYIDPLNLQYIFQNTLAGNVAIFTAIFFIGMSILAGSFKMKGEIYVLLMGLSGLLLYNWLGGGFYLLVIIIGSLFVYWSISKLVK